MIIELKFCSKCKELVPMANFNRNRSKPDGLHNICKPCRKQYARNNKAAIARYYRWRDANRHKVRTHDAVYRAVKAGSLTKPDHCEGCNTKTALQGHHADYTKPLQVLWLCVACHNAIHRELRQRELTHMFFSETGN